MVFAIQQLIHLGALPQVAGTFASLAIGGQGRVKGAVIGLQLARQPGDGFMHHPGEVIFAGQGPGFGVEPQQLGIVGQGLLEMRSFPAVVAAIAEEAASELVVEAAGGHAAQAVERNLPGFAPFRQAGCTQQQLQLGTVSEFRGVAKAAVQGIVAAQQIGDFARYRLLRREVCGVCLGMLQAMAQLTEQGLRLGFDLWALVAPGVSELLQGFGKAGVGQQWRGWKIGAGMKGNPGWGEEDTQWPAALVVAQQQAGALVDAVEVWPLFAVDEDADEMAVEQLGLHRVGKAGPPHALAGMAGAVTD